MDNLPAFYRYWGKARKGEHQAGDDYHLLPYHCLDVAAVGYHLLAPESALNKDLAGFLDITSHQLRDMVVFSLALHDIGKFASAFQQLYTSEDKQLYKLGHVQSYDSHDYRHDRLGLYFWEQFKDDFFRYVETYSSSSISDRKQIAKSWLVLMNCVFGHHGQPVENRLIGSMADFTEPQNIDAAQLWLKALFKLLSLDLPLEHMADTDWRKRLQQASWQLAGVAVLADWVGSNQDYFPYQSQPSQSLANYWDLVCGKASDALVEFGLNQHINVAPFRTVQEHFGFTPTPLQAWAEQVPVNNMPQLFILEDITGAGKTEAALTLTHRLMAAGAADGFYFGLPTMATSNAMFRRVTDHYMQMYSHQGVVPGIVLAHGARDMNEQFQKIKLKAGNDDLPYASHDQTATAQCASWLADSRKKALLAPVGVGTIDQALMAVIPRRHQSLRLLGLHRKILIFDEIHAADDYMFELLEGLLKLHFHQGGSVILLTATLPLKQRQRLVDIWRSAAGLSVYPLQRLDFPLATHVSFQNMPDEISLGSRASVSRRVQVDFLHQEQACLEVILQAVANDQCVVWVRNSVKDAFSAYQAVLGKLKNPEDCILFHSRFTLQDRQDTEHRVLAVYGKGDGKTPHQRAGKVLISTQIFQESIDADADVMISDLCPIDDLIQRAGRLRRHIRDTQGNFVGKGVDQREKPVLYVHAPEWDAQPESDWLSRNFQNTEYVYRSPGRLWLGQKVLRERGAIRMPEEARILIEAVYREDKDAHIPESLLQQEISLMGDERAKASRAWSLLLNYSAGYCAKSSPYWHEDIGDIGTRYSDVETVDVLVLRKTETGYEPLTGTIPFTVPLSTVKVPKKEAVQLAPVDELVTEAIRQQYRNAQFLQCWIPELDSQFCYDAEKGFYEQTPR